MSTQIPDFTHKIDWLAVNTCFGMQYIPLDEICFTRKSLENLIRESDSSPEEVLHAVAINNRDFLEIIHPDNVWSVSLVTGYGARLSSPGYSDCTEWTIHSTPTAAINHVRDSLAIEEMDRENPDFDVCYKRDAKLFMIHWMKG